MSSFERFRGVLQGLALGRHRGNKKDLLAAVTADEEGEKAVHDLIGNLRVIADRVHVKQGGTGRLIGSGKLLAMFKVIVPLLVELLPVLLPLMLGQDENESAT